VARVFHFWKNDDSPFGMRRGAAGWVRRRCANYYHDSGRVLQIRWRFGGTLSISWNSFQAADNSTIVMQTTTVKVIDGNLRVQLAPGSTAAPPSFIR
jgi:hypothetical protein